MCIQLRDLYLSISVLKKRLEELKQKTELMVYTLPHKRSGAIEVDVDRGVVFTSDLVNGVVLPELQSAARVEMSEETTYVLDQKQNVWVDKRSVIVDKCDDTKTLNMADAANKFRDLFKGKHYSFPDHAKHIIAASTIPASGALDWGIQSVIFRTLKAVAETMEINLAAQTLTISGIWSLDLLQDVWPKSSMRFLIMQKE
jgi:hypothetical protein